MLASQPSAPLALLRSCALAASLVLAGCLGGESDQVIQPTTATLSLTVTPPPGVSVQLGIAGPYMFTKTIAVQGVTSVVLDGLVPGPYVFTAPVVTVPTSLIDVVWAVDSTALVGKSLTLVAGKTVDLALTYAIRPGSGSVFLTRFGDARTLGGWPASALLPGQNPPATEQVQTAYEDWAGAAVDSLGGIWLLANDLSTSTFLYLQAAQLLPGQTQPTPTPLQAGGRLNAFCLDGAGGIWGASRAAERLYYWSATTVELGNLLTPDVALQGAAGALDAPVALAFDSVGSLWVSNSSLDPSGGTVSRLVPRQLTASGYALPTVTLSVPAPTALAFDSFGALWAVSGANSLVQFTAQQLGGDASASATPHATIPLDADAIASALAFDALGDLLVAVTHSTDNSEALLLFAPGQLEAGGAQTPLVALTAAGEAGASSLLVIDPTPAGLPLSGAPH